MELMRKYTILILSIVLALNGCARQATVRRLSVKAAAIEKIAEAQKTFTVGEQLTYAISWKGIPVGRATATIEEITTIDGYEVYKIVVVARANDFLSKIYKIEDTYTTYMDTKKFISRRYEAIRREGNYKKDLVVTYDFDKLIAYYKNLRDGTVKTCPIDKNVQDPVSASYFCRTISANVGETIELAVNLNEKNYKIYGFIEKRALVTLPKLGAFNAVLVKPYVKLDGKRQKRANAWGYFSTDERRLGLYGFVKVLELLWIGEITATLEKVEYLD